MLKLFANKTGFSGAEGVWPLQEAVAVMRRRYDLIEDLEAADGHHFFGVNDSGVNFVIVFKLVDGSSHGGAGYFSEVYFLASFGGFEITDSALEATNRNLHFCNLSFIPSGEILLVGGAHASGGYSDAVFGMLLDAWRRDLMVTMQALTGASAATTFAEKALERTKKFMSNEVPAMPKVAEGAPAEAVDPRERFRPFLTSAGGAKAICEACGGRGKTGFVTRTCTDCSGTGLTKR